MAGAARIAVAFVASRNMRSSPLSAGESAALENSLMRSRARGSRQTRSITLVLITLALAGAGLLLARVFSAWPALAAPLARARCVPREQTDRRTQQVTGKDIKRNAAESASTTRTASRTSVTAEPGAVGNVTGELDASEVSTVHNSGTYKRLHRYGDLPALPQRRSPSGGEWDNSVAICACMLGENMTDVREWLLYHQWLGVDHVYLTQNSDPMPEHVTAQLRDFVAAGYVTLRAVPRPEFQAHFYFDCMQHHRHKYNWLAFIDVDEFIVLRKRGVSLRAFLDGFKNEAALAVHWVLMGPSGHEARPAAGGALRHYTRCAPVAEGMLKSIANTWFLANSAANPHNFEYRNNRRAVNERRAPVPWRHQLPAACTDGSMADAASAAALECRPVPGINLLPGSAKDIALFHYITKSRQDFDEKMDRGGGGGTHRTLDQFKKMQSRSKDAPMCREAAALADRCCDPQQYTLLPPSSDAAEVANAVRNGARFEQSTVGVAAPYSGPPLQPAASAGSEVDVTYWAQTDRRQLAHSGRKRVGPTPY